MLRTGSREYRTLPEYICIHISTILYFYFPQHILPCNYNKVTHLFLNGITKICNIMKKFIVKNTQLILLKIVI